MALRNSLCSALTGLALLVSSPNLIPSSSAQTPNEKTVYLGSAEFGSKTKVPMIGGGGKVEINVKLSFNASNSTIKSINEGISTGKYKEPFADNQEFMNLLLDSTPCLYEIKFLKINYETRLYYFFDEELGKMKEMIQRDPECSESLKKNVGSITTRLKKNLPNAVRPNDSEGSKIVLEKSLENGKQSVNIRLYSSEKRGSKLVDDIKLEGDEIKVYDKIKDLLMKKQKDARCESTEYGTFDDVIKEARKNGIVK